MSNTNDLVNSAATGNLQEFKHRFSGLLAEKSVDFLSARSTEVSRSLVTECDCGCDADLEEVTKLHRDTHKIKKTKYGYQLFIYSPKTGKFIAQGPPHKTKREAEKDAKKFESVNEMTRVFEISANELNEATKWKMGDGRPRNGARIENVRFWNLPKDQLKYIIKDAGEAMRANPKARKATTGPGNWADQVNDASTVLAWRKKNNIKESFELDEATQHTIHVKTSRTGYRKLEAMIASLDGYKESEFEKEGKASFTFDAKKHDGTERKKVAEFIKKVKGVKFSHSVKESNLHAIAESANTKMPIDIDIDGQIIHMTPDVAENLINLHDELNESNQKDMIDMLESDKSSFLNIVKFAQRRQ